MNTNTKSLSHHSVSINFKNAFNSMTHQELLEIKNTLINMDKMSESSVILKELNFSNFINNASDKQNRLQFVCDILKHTNFSSPSNAITSMDFSNNNLNDNDLQTIIHAINNNQKTQYCNTIHHIDLSFNAFKNNTIINQLFKTLGTKFVNLISINLEQSGILCSSYDSNTLETFNINASITWFASHISNDNDTIEFAFEDESDDETDEEEEEDDSNDMAHSDENLFDDVCDNSHGNDYDCNSPDIDNNMPQLHIAYSLGTYPSNSIYN